MRRGLFAPLGGHLLIRLTDFRIGVTFGDVEGSPGEEFAGSHVEVDGGAVEDVAGEGGEEGSWSEVVGYVVAAECDVSCGAVPVGDDEADGVVAIVAVGELGEHVDEEVEVAGGDVGSDDEEEAEGAEGEPASEVGCVPVTIPSVVSPHRSSVVNAGPSVTRA